MNSRSDWKSFEGWIQALEHRLDAELPEAQARIFFTALKAETQRAPSLLTRLRSEIEVHPEFFEMGGHVAPEIQFFLSQPEVWTEKHLPALQRRTEWITGRLAILNCLARSSSTGSSADAQLSFRSSVTHSDGHVIACGSRSKNGLGIDLERTSRNISTAAVHRIASEAERGLGLTPIELWTIKEASFKALQLQPPATISQIVVNSIRGAKTGESSHLTKTCRYWIQSSRNWTVCVAFEVKPDTVSV